MRLTPALPAPTLRHMDVQLTPDQRAFVQQAIDSGRLRGEEDAVKEAHAAQQLAASSPSPSRWPPHFLSCTMSSLALGFRLYK